MDAIAGFMSENGVIVLLVILATIGLLWLLSRFFKLTLIIVIVVLVFLAFQHFVPSGDLKTKFTGVVDRVAAKAGEVVASTKEFFTDQRGRMQKHMNDARENGEKKDEDKGTKRK
jgi:cell shape-determining protein MreC